MRRVLLIGALGFSTILSACNTPPHSFSSLPGTNFPGDPKAKLEARYLDGGYDPVVFSNTGFREGFKNLPLDVCSRSHLQQIINASNGSRHGWAGVCADAVALTAMDQCVGLVGEQNCFNLDFIK